MSNTNRTDRRIRGLFFALAIAALGFALYSAAVAMNTRDDCGNADKEWNIFPPEWRCNTAPGFG